ncbi:MAG: hypothetical protein M3Y28_04785 [Armatimonadota bacterium]|nr:hypothetical protein [Armatimonadota bacterium]
MSDNSDAPVGEQVKQQAQQAVQQGQQLATRAWDTGRSQFKTLLTAQKDGVATRLDDVAKMLQQSGSQLREQGQAGGGQIAERLADRVAQISTTVHDKEIEEIIADTEDFARARPAVFLSVVGLLGFILARFLKSSSHGLATGKA